MRRDAYVSTALAGPWPPVRLGRLVLVAILLAASAAVGAEAQVPPPGETPVEIVVSGRTSTLKSIRIVKTGRNVPPNFSEGKVKNTPGYTWYVSRHFAMKTDMSEEWAHDCLTWTELAYPHMVRVIGAEPEGIDRKRMAFAYGKTLASMREATYSDGGFRWRGSGGGVTFDFLRAAYNYPSGSLRYHKRDLVIHENLHLLQACVTGSCYSAPYRFLEGVTYAFANHVYDRDKKQLTIAVLDKPTINNPYDAALRAMARGVRPIRAFLDHVKAGPEVGLYTQFMWTDPDRLMKWRLWRDEMFACGGRDVRKDDLRLMREIFGDLDRLNEQWTAWVAARRSTFHYVDWGWEQSGDTLWSYGWPQKTLFSQTNINLPLGEVPVPDPLRMDYPAAAVPSHLVGPVARGTACPSVAAVLDFSRNPGRGLCGLALGVITKEDFKRPAKLPDDAPGQVNVYVQTGKTLVIDGASLNLAKTETPIPSALAAAAAADGHRFGLTVRVAGGALEATVRAGVPGSVESAAASLPLTAPMRRRLLRRPSAVIAKGGYHGVTPLFDATRPTPPDLNLPAPANRWRFAGEDQTYRLYRAARKLGEAAPRSLLALRDRLAEAMDAPPAAQQAAMDAYAADFRHVVDDVCRLGPKAPVAPAVAELLGVSMQLRFAADASADRPKLVARINGPAEGRLTGEVTFHAGPARKPAEPVRVAAGPGQVVDAAWVAPPAVDAAPFCLHASAEMIWAGVKLSLSDSRVVFPSIGRWMTLGPFDAKPASTVARDIEQGPVKLDAGYRGKAGRTVRWRPHERPGRLDPASECVVDFKQIYGGTQAAAYALVWVVSDKPADAVLALGADDGACVWLNDRRIHSTLIPRAYESMQDRIDLRLNEGPNKLLIKVTQTAGDWKLCAHLLDKTGAPLTGVTYSLEGVGK